MRSSGGSSCGTWYRGAAEACEGRVRSLSTGGGLLGLFDEEENKRVCSFLSVQTDEENAYLTADLLTATDEPVFCDLRRTSREVRDLIVPEALRQDVDAMLEERRTPVVEFGLPLYGMKRRCSPLIPRPQSPGCVKSFGLFAFSVAAARWNCSDAAISRRASAWLAPSGRMMLSW